MHQTLKYPELLYYPTIAEERNQTLAQMAIAWILRDERITSVLVGASRSSQLLDSIKALDTLEFDAQILLKIEEILKGE